MGRRWRRSARNLGTASVGWTVHWGASCMGRGEEEKARKSIPPAPRQGARRLTSAERTAKDWLPQAGMMP